MFIDLVVCNYVLELLFSIVFGLEFVLSSITHESKLEVTEKHHIHD